MNTLGAAGFDFNSDYFDIDSAYILGIDPGLANTGWCVSLFDTDNNGKIQSTVIDCGCIQSSPKDGGLFERSSEIAKQLFFLKNECTLDCFVFEQYRGGNPKTAAKQNYCRGFLDAVVMLELGLIWPHVEINSSHLKKWIAGKGNANKSEILMKMMRRFESEDHMLLDLLEEHKSVVHEHIIEAYAMSELAYCALRQICTSSRKMPALIQSRQEVIKNMMANKTKYVFAPGKN